MKVFSRSIVRSLGRLELGTQDALPFAKAALQFGHSTRCGVAGLGRSRQDGSTCTVGSSSRERLGQGLTPAPFMTMTLPFGSRVASGMTRAARVPSWRQPSKV